MVSTIAADAHYIQEVRDHYETYPYPLRDPEREKTYLRHDYSCALDSLNYYHFSGKRDFSQGFRVLVAGGGTGDAIILLAEQLREMKADVVYLDISEASMQVAKDRAKIRELSNITWVHGSLLDAPKLVEGTFDFINCAGVLHHLTSPEGGLAALASVLKDDGVMGLMLYAKYGREGVYQIQNLMRIVNKDEPNMQRKVDNCKAVLKHLPATNPFHALKRIISDIETCGDVGIYDLLLHSHDVAYSIPDVYTFLSTSRLELGHLFFDQYTDIGNDLYRLESYFNDGSMAKLIDTLSVQEKQAAAELMHGKIIKHAFYASRQKPSLPSLDDLDNVPSVSMMIHRGAYREICDIFKKASVGQEITFNLYLMQHRVVKTLHSEQMFAAMDGHKSIGEILRDVRASYPANTKKPSIEELKEEFALIFTAFNKLDWMFLRHKSAPGCRTIQELQSRVTNIWK